MSLDEAAWFCTWASVDLDVGFRDEGDGLRRCAALQRDDMPAFINDLPGWIGILSRQSGDYAFSAVQRKPCVPVTPCTKGHRSVTREAPESGASVRHIRGPQGSEFGERLRNARNSRTKLGSMFDSMKFGQGDVSNALHLQIVP